MPINTQEIIVTCTAIGIGAGAILRHVAPYLISLGPNSRPVKFKAAEPSNGKISLEEHTLLCAPIKQSIEDVKQHTSSLSASMENTAAVLRWLRALAVVQATPESISKANDIAGPIGD